MIHKDAAFAAVEAARKLFLKYKSINNLQDINALIPITRKISSGWSHEAKLGLVDAAKELTGLAVSTAAFSRPSGAVGIIGAMIVRDLTSASIMVADGHNFCWSRFMVAKELCHLIQGSVDTSTMSSEPSEVINLISDLLSPETAPLRGSKLFDVESAAYFGAIELLLPMEFEAPILKMIQDGTDIIKIAQTYKIPQLIVEARYTNPLILNLYKESYSSTRYQNAEFFPLPVKSN